MVRAYSPGVRFVSSFRWGVVLSVLAVCGCQHVVSPGDYAFTADQIVRDDCGLLTSPESLPDGTLYVNGEVARMIDELYDIELRGKFKENSETFYLDGSASTVPGTARGQACTFGLVALHIEGSPSATDPNVFSGTFRGDFQTRNNFVCTCILEATFTARLKAP